MPRLTSTPSPFTLIDMTETTVLTCTAVSPSPVTLGMSINSLLSLEHNIMRRGLRASVYDNAGRAIKDAMSVIKEKELRADAIEQMKLSLIGTLQNLKYGQHHYVESYPNTSSWKSGFESHRGLQSGPRGTENERMMLSHKSGTSIPSFLDISRPTLKAA